MHSVRKFLLITVSFCVIACATKHDAKAPGIIPTVLPRATAETEAILEKAFPGAMPGPEFADSILHYIHRKYNVAADQMLLGASMCVDDIIYTKLSNNIIKTIQAHSIDNLLFK